MTANERELLLDRAACWRRKAREGAGSAEPFLRGMASGYELAADSLDRFLGESTVTPLEEAIDPDEAHKDAIRATVIESIAMDHLSGRQEEIF